MQRLPAEEDRLQAYTRLLRERFGEEPKQINEGRGAARWCPQCLTHFCDEHQGR